MFLFPTRAGIIGSRALPVWLGWVGVVLGLAGLVLGAPAAAVWVLLASIVVLVRAGKAPIGTSTAPATSPPAR